MSVSKCPSIRSIVACSNRSTLYSAVTVYVPFTSSMKSVRSNSVPPLAVMLTSFGVSTAFGELWYAMATWNSGDRLMSRCGCRSATSFSNGTSAWL